MRLVGVQLLLHPAPGRRVDVPAAGVQGRRVARQQPEQDEVEDQDEDERAEGGQQPAYGIPPRPPPPLVSSVRRRSPPRSRARRRGCSSAHSISSSGGRRSRGDAEPEQPTAARSRRPRRRPAPTPGPSVCPSRALARRDDGEVGVHAVLEEQRAALVRLVGSGPARAARVKFGPTVRAVRLEVVVVRRDRVRRIVVQHLLHLLDRGRCAAASRSARPAGRTARRTPCCSRRSRTGWRRSSRCPCTTGSRR